MFFFFCCFNILNQAVWTSLGIGVVGMTIACQVPKGQAVPLGTPQLMAFVVRPAISGTTSILLAAPTSALLYVTALLCLPIRPQIDPGSSPQTRQNPYGGPAWMWVIPVAMISCTVIDVHFVNKSLKYNDALLHAPVCFVLWQVFSLVCGAIIYEETEGFKDFQWIMAGTGVGCTLVGVIVSTSRLFYGTGQYIMVTRL